MGNIACKHRVNFIIQQPMTHSVLSTKFAKEYTHLKEYIMLMKKYKFCDRDRVGKEFMTNDEQETLASHCKPEKQLQPLITFMRGYNYTIQLTKK